jgi:hypothetical protein
LRILRAKVVHVITTVRNILTVPAGRTTIIVEIIVRAISVAPLLIVAEILGELITPVLRILACAILIYVLTTVRHRV